MLAKHPLKVPVIVERAGPKTQQIAKKKFLVPRDLCMGQMSDVIRKQLHLRAEDALFLFVGGPPGRGTLASVTSTVGSAHSQHADEDCFLYIIYNQENYFGAPLT